MALDIEIFKKKVNIACGGGKTFHWGLSDRHTYTYICMLLACAQHASKYPIILLEAIGCKGVDKFFSTGGPISSNPPPPFSYTLAAVHACMLDHDLSISYIYCPRLWTCHYISCTLYTRSLVDTEGCCPCMHACSKTFFVVSLKTFLSHKTKI